MSIFLGELFKMQCIMLCQRKAYHPKTNGQIKVIKKGLETYLRCFVRYSLKWWNELICWTDS